MTERRNMEMCPKSWEEEVQRKAYITALSGAGDECAHFSSPIIFTERVGFAHVYSKAVL